MNTFDVEGDAHSFVSRSPDHWRAVTDEQILEMLELSEQSQRDNVVPNTAATGCGVRVNGV